MTASALGPEPTGYLSPAICRDDSSNLIHFHLHMSAGSIWSTPAVIGSMNRCIGGVTTTEGAKIFIGLARIESFVRCIYACVVAMATQI